MAGRVRVAGSGVLYDGERVLLARRHPASRFFGDFFAFVGGALEAGESPVEATRREIKEELGLTLPGDGPFAELGVLTTPPFSPVRFETHFFAFPLPPDARPEPQNDELVEVRRETPAEWLRLWHERALRIPPPVLHILRILADSGPGEASWQACRAEAGELADDAEGEGKLHRIVFVPGLVMAPLRTPTLPPATHTNTWLIGERRGFVIDPASTEEGEQARLDALMAELGFTPEAVVLTHHHHDHAAGARTFADRHGIPIRAHARTAELLGEGVRGDITDGDRLETDAEAWRVVFTPGHAPGHIALFGETSKSLIAGDMVSTISTIVIDPPEGHMGTYLASLDRLDELGADGIYPAHGPPSFQPGKVLGRFRKHRLAREEQVFEAVGEAPDGLDAIVPKAYADTDERLWPLARRSALAHLEHLVELGRVELCAGSGEEGTWRRVS